jgi:aspartokinase/homoserine dehydrogenase 1
LEQILTLASENGNYKPLLKNLKPMHEAVDLSEEFIILEKLFEGVSLIDYSKKDQRPNFVQKNCFRQNY